MKTCNHLLYFAFSAISLFNLACSKQEAENPNPEPVIEVTSEDITSQKPTIITDFKEQTFLADYAAEQEKFDWENQEYLPLPPNNPLVPMPWSNRAKSQFSADIRADYKKSDGWELYLSTFSSKFRNGNLSFSLYNKYRGILRYYFFVGSGTQNFPEYRILQNRLFTTENSPLLNFTSQYIIDVNKNINNSLGYEPQQLADSSWYAVELELAFDKNIYSYNSNFQLGCELAMVKKNALLLNGLPLNELPAKVRLYDVTQAPGNFINQNVYCQLYGQQDLAKLSSSLSGTGLNAVNPLQKGQILNGLLYSPTGMNVKWNTTLNLQLPLNGISLLNESFYAGGSNLSSIQVLAPFYGKALGVFYLNKNPRYSLAKDPASRHPYQYTLDINSVEYLFNPAVLTVADIQNLHQELVATEEEQLINQNQRAALFTGAILKSNKPLTMQGVRVSFDLVPKNGGNTIHFIKTFKADLKG